MVRFNPTDKKFKSIIGALKEDQSFNLSLQISKDISVKKVYFCFYKDGQQDVLRRFLPIRGQEDGYNVFGDLINFAFKGLYFYYFEVETQETTKYICATPNLDGVLCDEMGTHYQLTIYRPQKYEANWFKGGLVYHIFVDRFAKSDSYIGEYQKNAIFNDDWYATPDHRPVNGEILNNEFFGGNIKGICEKLDYIKSLGVTTIYLSPIFKASSNHKYNTGDYLQIDEGFGDEKIFAEFLSQAKKYDIKVILDGVFNHTGDDSIYFNRYGNYYSIGAYQSKDSPYRDWFDFIEWPEVYHSWWGIDTLPSVNEKNPAYRDFICERVVAKWLKMGVDGFRLDVVDELPDDFLDPLCKAIKEQGDKVIIGEVWENATDKIAYSVRRRYFQGGQLDSVMNYPLKDAIIGFLAYGDGHWLKNVVLQQLNNYPKDALDKLFNLLSSHDTKRVVTALSGVNIDNKDGQSTFKLEGEFKQICQKKQRLAAVLQYMLYGVPCLFYGDEAGLEGFSDPFCRKCYPWGREDLGLVEFYKTLGKIRQDKLFVDASVENLSWQDGVFAFDRQKNGVAYKIFVNIGNQPQQICADDCKLIFGELDQNNCVLPLNFAILRTK